MIRRPTFLGFQNLNWWERREADAIDAIEASEYADQAAIAKLQAQVRELSMALAASLKVMIEMTGIDMAEFDHRVVAELDAMKPPPVPANAVNPTKAPVPDVAVRCDACGTQVSSTKTTITERGTMCDACAGA